MKTYWNITGGLSQLEEWQPNCWMQVTCPTEEDRQKIAAVRHEASIKAVKRGIGMLNERLRRLQDGEERATVNA